MRKKGYYYKDGNKKRKSDSIESSSIDTKRDAEM